MREARLESHLAFTIGTHTRAERKPSPALLLRAAAQLQIAPAQILYVGDSVIDMEAAHAAGCRAIAVSYGYDARIRGGHGLAGVSFGGGLGLGDLGVDGLAVFFRQSLCPGARPGQGRDPRLELFRQSVNRVGQISDFA